MVPLRAIAFSLFLSILTAACAAGEPIAVSQPSRPSTFPSVFIENRGQWDPSVRYAFDGRSTKVLFGDSRLTFHALGPSRTLVEPSVSQVSFSATFVGARTVTPVSLEPLAATVNLYRGGNPSAWHRNLPTFGCVAYKGLYDGVDLCVRGAPAGLKYEFRVAPGASWQSVAIKYDGIDSLSIDAAGALHVRTALGEMVDAAPLVYQDTPAGRVTVSARFALVGDCAYGFDVTGSYDESLALILDPELAWASYVGASYDSEYQYLDTVPASIAVDAAGNLYLLTRARSSFPVTDSSTNSGDWDGYVAKVSPSGALLWASYIGGTNADCLSWMRLDGSGNLIITGYTASTNFPTASAYDASANGGRDAVVMKLDPAGHIVWSTYLGGALDDTVSDAALDPAGDIFLFGDTASVNFPTPNGIKTAYNRFVDMPCFAARMTSDGRLSWSTYFGAIYNTSVTDRSFSIESLVPDGSGGVCIAGNAYNATVPSFAGYDTTYSGAWKAFIIKMTPSGQVGWGTYLHTWLSALLPDASGNLFAVGTPSPSYPSLNAFQATLGSIHISKLSPSGQMLWASPFGGTDTYGNTTTDTPRAFALDSSGDLLLAGGGASANFPLKDAFQTAYGGMFAAKISSTGAVAWASYLGPADARFQAMAPDSSGGLFVLSKSCSLARVTPAGGLAWLWSFAGTPITPKAVAASPDGGAIVAGETAASDFPAQRGFQRAYGGNGLSDLFVAEVAADGRLRWGSYLGGAGADKFKDMRLDPSGNPVILGFTDSADFPAPRGFKTRIDASKEFFVARVITSTVEIATGALPPGTIGESYDCSLAASDGTAPYVWSVPSGALPDGLALDAVTGRITGTPTSADTWSFTARVTDSQDPAGIDEAAFSIAVSPGPLVISTATLPAAVVDVAYSQSISATGGVRPYAWSVVSGTLPAGLSLDGATGIVSGTAHSLGTASFTVRVSDSQGVPATADRSLSIPVLAAPLSITTASVPSAVAGDAYTSALAATGGLTPYAWDISAGALPAGLSIDAATGFISGTPTTSGAFAFTARVTDSLGASATKALSLSVGDDKGPAITALAIVPTQVREAVDSSVALTATATDAASGGSIVTAAEYFIGSDPGPSHGTAMQAADGAFNSGIEALTSMMDASSWAMGPHVVGVRARDMVGNWGGSSTIVVSVVDGVAPAAPTDLALSAAPGLEKLAGQPWQTAPTDAPRDETLTIDLGSTQPVGAVSLTACATAPLLPRKFTISTSADAVDWTTIAAQKDYIATRGAHLWQFESRAARYVRVTAATTRHSDGLYVVTVPEVAILTGGSGAAVCATWTATADNGDDEASGPAAGYDLRFSSVAITPDSFAACAAAPGLPAPHAKGAKESVTLPLGSKTGRVYAALRISDGIPNWSPLSNVATADVSATGLQVMSPADDATTTATVIPAFAFSLPAGFSRPTVVFSDRLDFPAKAFTNPDGTKSSTLRAALKVGSSSWRPAAAQWIAIKRLGARGSVYWRLEGTDARYAHISGPTRRLLFETGDISGLHVSPSHLSGSDEAVWPDKNSPPTFAWTNATQGMTMYYVDAYAGAAGDDDAERVTIGGGGGAGASYQATAADWLKLRKLAAKSGGILRWRVRATDKDKALIALSPMSTLILDGGQWTVGALALTSGGTRATWTHTGAGLARYNVQFSTDAAFPAGARTTVLIPATPIAGSSYSLTLTDLKRLKTLAYRNGVTTLHYRIRGLDADGAFVTYSPAQTTAAP